MDSKAFERLVKVRMVDGGRVLSVRSAEEASALLASTDWPGERTARHRDAFEAAEKVLEGYRSTEDARNAFVEAAREASVLVEDAEADQASGRIFFESSVRIRPHGSTTVREVRSVNGACEALIDWPHAKRGPYYQSARELVQDALDGKATPDQARDAFRALAEHAGILVGEQP